MTSELSFTLFQNGGRSLADGFISSVWNIPSCIWNGQTGWNRCSGSFQPYSYADHAIRLTSGSDGPRQRYDRNGSRLSAHLVHRLVTSARGFPRGFLCWTALFATLTLAFPRGRCVISVTQSFSPFTCMTLYVPPCLSFQYFVCPRVEQMS